MMGAAEKLWTDICSVEDIPVRGARIVKSPEGCIALFRTSDNEVFALDDQCPHKKGPLSQGIVHGKTVTCPLHNWVISLETGEATGETTGEDGKTQTLATCIVEGRVRLQLPAAALE